MSDFNYWPYEEVTLKIDDNAVSIDAPWIRLRTQLHPSEAPRYTGLSSRMAAQTLTAEDLPIAQSFFSKFRKFPLCYILPLKKSEAEDVHLATSTVKESSTLEGLLKSSFPAPSHELTQAVLQRLNRQTFEWDVDAAIQFAQVEGGVHPESAFTVARRYHLLDVLENDKGKEVFQYLEQLPQEERAKGVALLVRQNHFVTQRCRAALLPALEMAQSARPEVEAFIRTETGHDRILGLAMQQLATDPESVPVGVQTQCLMNLLQFAAKNNFLAFAMAIEFFERSPYEESDPLAQLLEKAGFPGAAAQINRHQEINDVGEHEMVACTFLSGMAPCSPDYVRDAFRIAETISLVMNTITSAAIQEFAL